MTLCMAAHECNCMCVSTFVHLPECEIVALQPNGQLRKMIPFFPMGSEFRAVAFNAFLPASKTYH